MSPSGVASIQVTCPGCGEDVTVPLLLESDRTKFPVLEVTVHADHDPLRQHLADKHPEVVSDL